MMTNNFVLYSLKILGEMMRDIVYFPLWWYSRGLLNLVERLINFVSDQEKSLALYIWIKNIFRPMYAQYDWQGRIISFLMRFIQIILRSLVMLFGILLAFVIFVFWVFLPPFVIYQIIFQLHG